MAWEGDRLFVTEGGRARLTRQGRTKLARIGVAVGLIVVALGGGVAAIKVTDKLRKDAARPAAVAEWRKVKQRLAERMRDQGRLDVGAVWATKQKRICGLVDGRGSFGGLSGMVPFFTDGAAIRYSLDTPREQFQGVWAECMGDAWLMLEEGSFATGICATKHPFKQCGQFGDYDQRW